MAHLLVLAGGFGTRLRAAVADVPKPLAPVAGRPYLYYLNEHWLAQGITQLTYLLHYQAELIEAFVREQQHLGTLNIPINFVVEPEPMGTGGAIAYAVRELGLTSEFLVANADTWLGGGMQQIAAAQAPAMATVQVPNVERYGNVEIKDAHVIRFREKQERQGPGYINAGLYHLHANMFADWNGQPFSVERDMFPQLAECGGLQAVSLHENFIDIGVPEDYFRFCCWIESGKRDVL